MTEHKLKTHPAPFFASMSGEKPWEFRFNDRNFQVGDTLVLQWYDPDRDMYSGHELRREVVFILEGGQFGIPAGYVVMTVQPIDEWIEYDGSGCPVSDDTLVHIRLRIGEDSTNDPPEPARAWWWGRRSGTGAGEIIAYKVVDQ